MAELLLSVSSPAATVINPVLILVPDSVRVPAPAFVNAPDPDSTPESVTALALVIVAVLDKMIALVTLTVEPVIFKLLSLSVTEPVPKLVEPATESVPAVTFILALSPLSLPVFDKVRLPDPALVNVWEPLSVPESVTSAALLIVPLLEPMAMALLKVMALVMFKLPPLSVTALLLCRLLAALIVS